LNQFEDFVKPGRLSIQPKIDSIGRFRGGLSFRLHQLIPRIFRRHAWPDGFHFNCDVFGQINQLEKKEFESLILDCLPQSITK
jgi:hypothetical protein